MTQQFDVDWNPPIETGLSKNPYPNVEMNEYIDTIEEAHQPGVYVLELSTPNSKNHELYHRLWLDSHSGLHPELEQIIESDRLLYVGEANDVLSRLEDHLDNPNRSTTLGSTFPIHSIVDVDFYNTKTKAEEHERDKADQLRQNNPNWHIHCR
jgi:predicted GIY-YIG superfamily endonuclease